jgi:hypothetical protein
MRAESDAMVGVIRPIALLGLLKRGRLCPWRRDESEKPDQGQAGLS